MPRKDAETSEKLKSESVKKNEYYLTQRSLLTLA